MEKIIASSQASAEKKAEKMVAKHSEAKGETSKSTKSKSLQHVMAPERRDALMEVLERMHITTGADSLEQRIQNYQNRYLKPIRPFKYQQLLDEPLGFMCSTKLVSEGWKITHQAFSKKLSELANRYSKHPKTFPAVDMAGLKKTIDIEEIRSMPFAQKIIEVGGERHLMRAALHRVVAQTTIANLYADEVLFKPAVDLYLSNQLSLHLYGREKAMLDCLGVTCQTELSTRSLSFFLERNALSVEPFCGL